MQRGITGYGGPERTGPDQVNAALVRHLIGDNLQIAEYAVNSRLHFAPRALRLTLQCRCAFGGPGRLCVRDGVLPQALPAAAYDIGRQRADAGSPGASGTPEE
jgi:hypothetical protein